MDEKQLFEAIERLHAVKTESILPWTLQTFTNRKRPPTWIRVNQEGYIALVEIAFKFFPSEDRARWSIDYAFMPKQTAGITVYPPPAELIRVNTATSRDLRTWGDTQKDTGGLINTRWLEAYNDILLRLYLFTRLSMEQCSVIEQQLLSARQAPETPAEAAEANV